MRKPSWKVPLGAVVAAALAAGALVATGATASAGKSTEAPASGIVCPLPTGALDAITAGSGRKRDLVTNQYDLPTPSGPSPFFTAPHTVNVYFHVIMNGPDTGADDDSTGDIPQSWITARSPT